MAKSHRVNRHLRWWWRSSVGYLSFIDLKRGEFDEILPPRDDISRGLCPRDISSRGGNISSNSPSGRSINYILYRNNIYIEQPHLLVWLINARHPTRGTRKLEYPAAAGYSKSNTTLQRGIRLLYYNVRKTRWNSMINCLIRWYKSSFLIG